jgi:hypothetical protein
MSPKNEVKLAGAAVAAAAGGGGGRIDSSAEVLPELKFCAGKL